MTNKTLCYEDWFNDYMIETYWWECNCPDRDWNYVMKNYIENDAYCYEEANVAYIMYAFWAREKIAERLFTP